MEDMHHEVTRLREAAQQLAGEHLDVADLVLPDAAAESGAASVRLVMDIVKALAIQMSALWEAVDLLAGCGDLRGSTCHTGSLTMGIQTAPTSNLR